MRATLTDAPDDHAILTAVGPGAFHRGLAYAREGRVTRLTFDPAERLLTGSVRGSGAARYSTVVELEARRPGGAIGLAGSCSCPVGVSCKHVAAVVFAARRSPSLAPPARPVAVAAPWEASLASVVRPPEVDAAASGAPVLALQVEVAAPTPATRRSSGPQGAPPRILVRPVVRGAKGGWIRTGATWRDVIHGYGRVTFAGAALDALRALHSQAAARNPYGFSDAPIDLATVGPGLWRLLDEVEAAGVPLVPDKATAGPVRLVQGGAGLVVDLRRDEGTGDATLEPLIDLGETRLPGAAAQYVGSPVHGLFAVGTPAGPGADASGAGPAGPGGMRGPVPSLVLARVRERATAQVIRLMSGGPLTIPAADVERFVGEYYPALRQVLTVTSSDGSVTFPEVAPPSLGLTLTHAEGHRVTLEWAFDYRLGDRVTRVPMAGAPSSGVVRDRQAEARLVSGLALPDDRFPSLRLATPERPLAGTASLEGLDAVAFLEDVLPGLRESGVAVEEAGEALDYRRSEAAPLIRVSATDSQDRDWFDLGVTVSVDGEDVPFVSLFTALARGQSHLLLDSGTYFSIERPEYQDLRRLIEEARSLEDREGPPRISRYQVSLWEDLSDLGEVTAQSERWSAAVRGLTAGLSAGFGDGTDDDGAAHPPVPAGLVADLRPYQREGYEWLTFLWEHELGGVLADDMGLGKTLQVLATIARAKEHGRLDGPTLVVAPTSVVPNWAREAARFTPGLRVVTVAETQARRGAALAEHVADADVVVTSYALFRIEFAAYEALPWSALVLDEAQFVKNHQAKTYQCARRLAAPVKIAVTGTPIENNLMDLWAMLSIAAPGLFPSAKRFTEVYRTPIEREGHAERLQILRRRIRPLMRRRTKEQVASELPPKVEQVLEVELNPSHRKVYDTHLQRERQKVLGMIGDLEKHRFAIFRSLTILRQLSLDAALVDDRYDALGSAKIDVLLENLRDVVDGGHRALVFSQFTGFLRRVRDRLDAEGVPYVYLDGRTRNRAARIEEFRGGQAPVFLISLKAGGFGLNLTEADYCFVLDPWWNPAVEAQAVDRTHRIGQDKTVMVYRLVSAGTIEEKVMALKSRKQALFDTVMDEDGLMSGPLTADDIRGLFE